MSDRKLIILFHGYGSNGDNMQNIANALAEKNDIVACPNGFSKMYEIPDGYMWFPLEERTNDYIYKQLQQVKDSIINYIQEQSLKYNIAYQNIILGGFSQGACLALFVSLFIQHELHSIISFSGGLPLLKITDINNISHIKQNIVIIHGEDDNVLSHQFSIQGYQQIKNISNATLHLIEELEHTIDTRCLAIAKNFIFEKKVK